MLTGSVNYEFVQTYVFILRLLQGQSDRFPMYTIDLYILYVYNLLNGKERPIIIYPYGHMMIQNRAIMCLRKYKHHTRN